MSIEDRNTSVASMILFRDFFFSFCAMGGHNMGIESCTKYANLYIK